MRSAPRRTSAPATWPPEAWAYNPSSWRERLPIVALGVLGMGTALYLAAYQLGIADRAWDPVFGPGTERVLESSVSRLFPVSDALLGAITYALDWVFGLVGDTHRYRTKPWAVVIFGIGIVPLGAVSIGLGLAMPVLVGSWCFLCIVNTAIGMAMIPLSWDEIWLTLLGIRNRMRGGSSLREALAGAPAAG